MALSAALLFGATTPLAKGLGADAPPFFLAGLLYFGSGLGLLVVKIIQRVRKDNRPGPFERNEISPFLAAIILGGIIAPVLLMFGLARLSGSTASLLLNVEAAFTALFACLFFKERYGGRLIFGMCLIVSGGAVLSRPEGNPMTGGSGVLFVVLACVCWALDNNFTRKVKSLQPTTLASAKGLIAGTVNCGIALLLRQPVPKLSTAIAASVIGFFGYGLSLVFFVLSLRRIGAARTSAYFSTAPFVGAAIAIFFFREKFTLLVGAAFLLMAAGVWLHLTENSNEAARSDSARKDRSHS